MNKKEILQFIKENEKSGNEQIALSNKGITTLPEKIGTLKNITSLDLKGNNLKNLPKGINKLKKLESLDLSNNDLRSFPLEVTNIPSLKILNLSHNKIEYIPTEIKNLSNLKVLLLNSNHLIKVPDEIENLNLLDTLNLEANPLNIPPEISSKGPSELIQYVLEINRQNVKTLNEAKVLLVGQGGVGKTSVVRRLTEDKFDENEKKTEGIFIKKWQIKVNESLIRLNVWDFGGQEIMHATHQFFLTKRSLYILVWDARQEDQYGLVEYWLKLIQSFGEDSPIIVVLNKIDVGNIELDRRGLLKKYPNIHAFVSVSCKSNIGFSELESTIKVVISNLEHIRIEWPKSWFSIKKKLERLNKNYIKYNQYLKMCKKEDISPIDSKNLINFLHDLGVVLNFQEDLRLRDTNVLNPEWITNAVYSVLNAKELSDNKGIFRVNNLSKILDPISYPAEMHKYIINIMKKFELCFEIYDLVPISFLIPDLLSREQPFFKWNYSYCLAFQYHYNFLPHSVISRFIVRMHPYILKSLAWRNGVVLNDGNNRALIKADNIDKKIFIYIDGQTNTRRDFLAKIRIHFEHIHKTIKKINAEAKVPLPENNEIEVSYNHLLTLERLGEEEFIPENYNKRVLVRSLLNGVDNDDIKKEYRVGQHIMHQGKRKYFLSLRKHPNSLKSVFVSSTYKDLEIHRIAVKDQISRRDLLFRGMEHFGASPDNLSPKEKIIMEVRDADVYLGIFGVRYGSIDGATGLSMTEMEFNEAVRCMKPMLLYVINEDAPVKVIDIETDPIALNKLKKLKNHILKNFTVYKFTTVEELSRQIYEDLGKIQFLESKIGNAH